MKKVLFALLLISGLASAQTPPGYTKISARYAWLATMADSGKHVPAYNGVPTDRVGVSNRDGAIAADTLNGYLYLRNNGVWKKLALFSDVPAAIDTTNKWVNTLYRRSDSVFYNRGGNEIFAYKDSTGGGTTVVSDSVNKYSWFQPANYTEKKYHHLGPVQMDSSKYFFLNTLAAKTLIESTVISSEGSTTPLILPSLSYGSFFIRDYCYAIQGRPDALTAADQLKVLDFVRTRLSSNIVPDHIDPDGTVHMEAGSWGSRSPNDNQCFFIDAIYQYYLALGKVPSYWNTYKTTLTAVMSAPALPLNGSGLVEIPLVNGWPDYGFNDIVVKSGVTLFGNLLAYRAYLQLAEMAGANGDYSEANSFGAAAETIKTYINTNMFVPTTVTHSPVEQYDGPQGMYKVATGTCSNNLDVWGSAFAVYIGLADEAKAQAIAKTLANKFDSSEYYFSGGFKHIFTSNYHSAGSAWDSTYTPVTIDTYQNGGYWYTPTPWFNYTLSLVNQSLAQRVQNDAYARMVSEGSAAPVEWFVTGTNGGSDYVASGTMPLINSVSTTKGWSLSGNEINAANFLGSINPVSLRFKTWNLTAMTIDSAKQMVGINVLPINAQLHIREKADPGYALRLDNRNNLTNWMLGVDDAIVDDGIFFIRNLSDATKGLKISPTGNVGVSSTALTSMFNVGAGVFSVSSTGQITSGKTGGSGVLSLVGGTSGNATAIVPNASTSAWGLTLPANGGTGNYTLINQDGAGTVAWGQVNLTAGVTGILPVANGGTGTATPALVAGTNITITGTWPNNTINATGGGGGSPGGASGNVQTNDGAGGFAGSSSLHYDGTALRVGSSTAIPSNTNLYVRGTGSSTGVWKGRGVFGGDNVAFLMGEYNSQAWLGAHTAALDAWADFYLDPGGVKKVYFGTPSSENMIVDNTNTLVRTRGNTYLSTNGGGVSVAFATNATAFLHIRGGVNTIAPLKIDSGTDLTTAEVGAFEFGSARLAFTPSGTTRKRIPLFTDATPTTGYLLVGNGTDFTLTSPATFLGSYMGTGTYTPTLANTANLDASTAHVFQYSWVIDPTSGLQVVTVSGYVDVDPTTTMTDTQLTISLPIATSFGNVQEAGGAANCTTIAAQSAGIRAVVGTDDVMMQWKTVDVSSQPMFLTFTYKVTPP